MRRLWLMPLVLLSVAVQANDTFRVGTKVLVTGGPDARAIDLLGTPVFKLPVESVYGAYVGENWQFKQENGRIVTVTILAGKVTNIEESQQY